MGRIRIIILLLLCILSGSVVNAEPTDQKNDINDSKSSVSDNMKVYQGRDSKYGLLDRKGKVILPFIYDSIKVFPSGVVVKLNGKYGVFNYSGIEILPVKYDAVNPLLSGLVVRLGNREWLFDYTGEKIKEMEQVQGIKKKFKVSPFFAVGPAFSFLPNFAFGGEVSLGLWSYLTRGIRSGMFSDRGSAFIAGVYSDFLHDTITGNNRFTIGPEIGIFGYDSFAWTGFGIDGGLVLSQGGGKHGIGYVIRPFTLLFLPAFVYYRYIRINESGEKNKIHEIGISIKFPVVN